MNHPNKNPQVDRQDVQCQLFEQQLDACLDGRGSLSTLVSDPHLDSCCDCRIKFDVYRQFDRAGGAVLNGGAGTLRSNRKQGTSSPRQRWLPLTSLAVAAALMIYVVAPSPDEQSNSQFAAIESSSLVSETSSSETSSATEAQTVAGDAQQQPTAEPFYEVGAISQRLLSSRWEKPWHYTSELPGIRPFHRSVKVALVFYNDSMTLL